MIFWPWKFGLNAWEGRSEDQKIRLFSGWGVISKIKIQASVNFLDMMAEKTKETYS